MCTVCSSPDMSFHGKSTLQSAMTAEQVKTPTPPGLTSVISKGVASQLLPSRSV
jgi:hypothetical protein